MTKKEIEKVLKAIRHHCKTARRCDDCIMRFMCIDVPSCMANSDIDVMAKELKNEVNKNDGD